MLSVASRESACACASCDRARRHTITLRWATPMVVKKIRLVGIGGVLGRRFSLGSTTPEGEVCTKASGYADCLVRTVVEVRSVGHEDEGQW